MGRPRGTKKYTAKALRDACNAYFDAISYEEPVTKQVLVFDKGGLLVLDKYGHPAKRPEPVITRDGREATRICWTEPPSLLALCLHLGIDKSTFARYQQDDKLRPVATEAKCRVEAYLAAKLEEKGAANGVKFNLTHNFGWNFEDDNDGPTELVVSFDAGGDDPFG